MALIYDRKVGYYTFPPVLFVLTMETLKTLEVPTIISVLLGLVTMGISMVIIEAVTWYLGKRSKAKQPRVMLEGANRTAMTSSAAGSLTPKIIPVEDPATITLPRK